MKRCPECGRDCSDDPLSFCLDDGSELLFGVAAGEHAMAILDSSFRVQPSGGHSSESATRSFDRTTASEAEFPTTVENRTERQRLSAHRAAQPKSGIKSLMIVGLSDHTISH